MQRFTTLHTFQGKAFRVPVRQDKATNAITMAIHQIEVEEVRQLQLFEFLCKGSAEAGELSRLLRSAAAMADFIEHGGSFEQWCIEAPMRCSQQNN